MNAPATSSAVRPAPRLLPPRGWRGLALLVIEGVAAGLFVSLVLALAVFIAATQAQAATDLPSLRGDDPSRCVSSAAASRSAVRNAGDEVPCADERVRDQPAAAQVPLFGLFGLAMVALGWVARRPSPGPEGRVVASSSPVGAGDAVADETAIARRADIARCVC